MCDKTTVLAFDFGASSGRAIQAEFYDEHFTYKEIHRFENKPIEQAGHLRWNFDALLREVQLGIAKVGHFDSIGFDTWGVDFGLLDQDGNLLELPVHYRDERTIGMIEKAQAILSAEELYAATGTQILAINTLFQLLALQQEDSRLLEKAQTLLFMPDLFTYAISGCKVCEGTIASTAALVDPTTGTWHPSILQQFRLPEKIFLPITPTGTVVGSLPNGASVVAVAGHDTQCAIAALPAFEPDTAFLSCGTWSLLGCELDKPILTAQSQALGLSNELGANSKVNYLKNIIGLWLIQESRRAWQRIGQDYSYAQLEELALASPALRCFIDPDDPLFASPGDLPQRVRDYCAFTGQYVPKTVGEVMRCIYESLALKYRFALEQLETVTGKHFSQLHILGGGTKDGLLCRMTAASIGRPVVAGPIEATALGNILIQLVALGRLRSIEEGRRLIARTEYLTEYLPQNTEIWNQAYFRYQSLLQKQA